MTPARLAAGRREFCRTAAAGIASLAFSSLSVAQQTPPATPAPAAKAAEPLAFVPGSFTLAVLPDTQFYCMSYPDHFYDQTQWIVDNAAKHNIQYVLHLGDITNNNVPDQWKVARRAMATLEGKVPFALVPGNHDYGPNGGSATRDTQLNDFFSFAALRKLPGFGGAMEDGRLENTYHTFDAAGHKYLILALEWGPRDKTVEWANTIASAHPDHRAILITHAYMYDDDTRYDWRKFGAKQEWNPNAYTNGKLPGGANDGEALWRKLVSRHPGFMMTLNGHVLHDGLGRLSSAGAGAQPVHQMLVNYQMQHEGGDGYLRLIEFLPDDDTLQIKAYSPSLKKYKTDEQNQFVLKRNA